MAPGPHHTSMEKDDRTRGSTQGKVSAGERCGQGSPSQAGNSAPISPQLQRGFFSSPESPSVEVGDDSHITFSSRSQTNTSQHRSRALSLLGHSPAPCSCPEPRRVPELC